MVIAQWQFRPRLLSASIVVIALMLLCTLGYWQWQRSVDKGLLEQRFERQDKELAISVEPATRLESFIFRRAEVKGEYDPRHQFLLDNRTYAGVAGYHVLTPLNLDSSKTAVLVNRGWIAVGPRRDQLPEIGAPAGVVTVAGTVSPAPRVVLLGSTGYESTGWPRVVQSVNWEAMEAAVGVRLLRAQIQLAPDQPDGFVRDWSPYYGISPQRHRAYSIQWYGLAATLFALYMAVTVKRIPIRRGEQ